MTDPDVAIVRNYLDWRYAIDGSFATVDLHRRLLDSQTPFPTVLDAREALDRIEARHESFDRQLRGMSS